MTKVQRSFTLLSVAFFFLFLGFMGAQQFITSFFASSGQPQAGFISLVLIYVFFIVGNPLAAWVTAKEGSKYAMVMGAGAYLFFLVSLATTELWLIWLASVFLGVAAAFLWTGNNTYLLRLTEQEKLGSSVGLFSTLLSLGQALGIIASGWLISILSYQWAFMLSAAASTIGWALLLCLPEAMLKAQSGASIMALLIKSFSSSIALRLSTIWFSFSLVQGLVIGLVPLILTQQLGEKYVSLSAIFFLMPVFMSFLLGKMSDKQGRGVMILGSLVVGILGLVCLLFSFNSSALIAGLVLLSLTYAAVFPMTLSLLGDVTSSKNLEIITASFWMVQNTAVVVSLLLASTLSTSQVMLISLVVFVFTIAIVFPLFRVPPTTLKTLLEKDVS